MDKDIRICFELYLQHINVLIKSETNLDTEMINKMSIDEIRTLANILHMKFILSSTYSLAETNVSVIAYKHLINLIDKNILLNKINIIDENYLSIKDRLYIVETFIGSIKENKQDPKNDQKKLDNSKGWLF